MKTIIKHHNDYFNKIVKELKKLKDDNYDTPGLRDYLEEIYGGVCCYCESKFSFSATFNIEHFYPKNSVNLSGSQKYHKHIRNLDNLHYSCPKCNNYKSHMCPDGSDSYYLSGNKPIGLIRGVKIYSPNYILSKGSFKNPDYKVEDKFEYDGATIETKNDSEQRGKGTIETFNLNNQSKERKERLALFENRQRYFIEATEISNLLKNNITSNNTEMSYYFLKKLGDMMQNTSPYSNMIRYHFTDIYDYGFQIVLNIKKELNS